MKKKKESLYDKQVRENNKGKRRPVYNLDTGEVVDYIGGATKQLKDKKKRNKRLVSDMSKRARMHNKNRQRQK